MFPLHFFYVFICLFLCGWNGKKNMCEMSVTCQILCTGLNFHSNAICICDNAMLFSLRFHNLSEIIQWVWCVHFCILREGLFTAAVVSLGWQDFLCKDESKHMLHDMMHNSPCVVTWCIIQHALCFLSNGPILHQCAWKCWIFIF